jgi:hypothetical protein
MVLGVEAALMAPRLEALCKLLQLPVETEVSSVLRNDTDHLCSGQLLFN